MPTTQVLATIDRYVAALQDSEYAISQVVLLSNIYETIASKIADLTVNLSDASQVTLRCRAFSDAVSVAVRAVKDSASVSRLFTSLSDVIERCNEAADELRVDSLNLNQILKDFETEFDEYIRNQSPDHATRLVVQAHRCHAAVLAFRDVLSAVSKSLSRGNETNETQQRLLMSFDAPATVAEVIERLSALRTAYDQICGLLQIDHSTSPLLITRIEAGSILADLRGDSKVIELMVDLIRTTGRLIHRKFFREGKLAVESDIREMLCGEIDLRNKLVAAGLNSDGHDELLQRFAKEHTESLLKIAYGSNLRTINGQAVLEDDNLRNLPAPEPIRRIESQQLAESPRIELQTNQDSEQ